MMSEYVISWDGYIPPDPNIKDIRKSLEYCLNVAKFLEEAEEAGIIEIEECSFGHTFDNSPSTSWLGPMKGMSTRTKYEELSAKYGIKLEDLMVEEDI